MADSDKLHQAASKTLYFAVLSGLLGAVGTGTGLGWSAPAFESMEKDPHIGPEITPDSKTWIGSALNLGALAGALLSGSFAQYFGRKHALVMYGVPFTIGWAILAFAQTVPLLILGRVIVGFSCGILSGTAPTYVVEIAIIKIRGQIGASFQLCLTVGIFLVYLIGAFVSWSVLSMLCAIPTIAMSICMLFSPESPPWLVVKHRISEAKEALSKLRGPGSNNEQEIKLLQEEALSSQKGEGFRFSMYKARQHYQPFILSMLLMFFQQFSGINVVMFYATDIFKEAGSTITPKYCTIIIGGTQVIATLISSNIVDRLGRKVLLNTSGALHVISTAMLGFFYWANAKEGAKSFGWIPLVSLMIFIIGFSIGFGPIPWLMVAEICPIETRSATTAIATTFNWLGAFIITKNYELFKSILTKQGTFFFFSLCSFLSIIFVVTMLPETKGKSNEEIQQFFMSKAHSASSSGAGKKNPTNVNTNTKSNNPDKMELEKLNKA